MIGGDMVKTLVVELEKLISTEKIVGKPQTFGDVTIIPVCSVGFGFGAGGGSGTASEDKEGRSKGSGEGAGGGAGGGVSPVALIVIRKEGVEVLPLKAKGTIASAIETMGETIPKVMDKAIEMRKMKGEQKGKK
jgi:uncharacterized spore protein YtfJ